MTNEMRSVTRVVPLWIILIASLVLTIWSVQQLAVSIVKMSTSAETVSSYSANMGMGIGGYNSYCLVSPLYPSFSSSMAPGTIMTSEDKLAMEKYNKEMEKYNEEYAKACKEDQIRQEVMRQKAEKSAWFGGVVVYAILSLLGIFSVALSLVVVKKNETV